jgi:hypothetical protein
MNIKRKTTKAILLLSLFFLAGCASYKANDLGSLAGHVSFDSSIEGVYWAAKAFNKNDCKQYLDRDVIRKGYQPVQLYIKNHSTKFYSFSPDRVSIPIANPLDIAKRVHTSTVGRAGAYTAAVFTSGYFAVPAAMLAPQGDCMINII